MKIEFKEYWEKNKEVLMVNDSKENTAKTIWEDAQFYMQKNIDNLITPILEVKKEVFLNWYFSDANDYKRAVKDMYNHLLSQKSDFSINMQEIFDGCGYIPSNIIEKHEEKYNEYFPKECVLID